MLFLNHHCFWQLLNNLMFQLYSRKVLFYFAEQFMNKLVDSISYL